MCVRSRMCVVVCVSSSDSALHIVRYYAYLKDHLNECYLCSLTLPHVNCITEQIICVHDTQN